MHLHTGSLLDQGPRPGLRSGGGAARSTGTSRCGVGRVSVAVRVRRGGVCRGTGMLQSSDHETDDAWHGTESGISCVVSAPPEGHHATGMDLRTIQGSGTLTLMFFIARGCAATTWFSSYGVRLLRVMATPLGRVDGVGVAMAQKCCQSMNWIVSCRIFCCVRRSIVSTGCYSC